MIRHLIEIFAPDNFDPHLLNLTEIYIWIMMVPLTLGILFILIPVIRRYVQVRGRTKFLKAQLKKTDDLQTLRREFSEKLFKTIKWAQPGYKAFQLAWEEARPAGEDRAIMPIRLGEFLSAEVVLDGARNRRLAEALPGIFVSMGIFGTFLGLVLGMRNLEIDKLEQLQDGVGHLMSGLSVAFLTSLCGIAFSVLFTLF